MIIFKKLILIIELFGLNFDLFKDISKLNIPGPVAGVGVFLCFKYILSFFLQDVSNPEIIHGFLGQTFLLLAVFNGKYLLYSSV